MRFLISTALIALLAFAVTSFTHTWWTLVIACAGVTFFMGLKPGPAFLSGFTGILLLWFAVALKADIANEQILSARMAKLFSLPVPILFLVTASVTGGIIGGLSAWTGAAIRKALRHR